MNQFELIRETIDQLVHPIAVTSLTAVIGFVSFGFSPLIPVRAFGIFTGIGALFGLFFSLTVVPALLALTKPAWLLSGPTGEATTAATSLGAWFAGAGEAVVRRRRWVAGFAVIGTALT